MFSLTCTVSRMTEIASHPPILFESLCFFSKHWGSSRYFQPLKGNTKCTKVTTWPLYFRLSLFPHVPPYHVFLPYWLEYASPPCPALRQEEWQFPAQIMPVVRDVVEHAGFRVKKVMAKRDTENVQKMHTLTLGLFWKSVKVKIKSQGRVMCCWKKK